MLCSCRKTVCGTDYPPVSAPKIFSGRTIMKKTVSLVLAIIMAACLASVIVSADVDPEIGINRLVSIYEAETAPIVDGVVTDGEYGEPIGVWPADTIMQSLGDYAKNMPVSI